MVFVESYKEGFIEGSINGFIEGLIEGFIQGFIEGSIGGGCGVPMPPEIPLQIRFSRGATITEEEAWIWGIHSNQKFARKTRFPEERRLRRRRGGGGGVKLECSK